MPIPESQTYEAKTPDFSEVIESSLLEAIPNYAFFLIHHPENWDAETEGLDEPTWLPQLQRAPMIPGVNTHRTRSKDEPASAAYEQAHINLRRRGFTIVPQDIVIDGTKGYLKFYDCIHPRTRLKGKLWCDRWEEVLPPRPGKRAKFSRDRAAYNQWRLALVELGYIAPPGEGVVNEKIARARYHLERKEGMTDLTEEQRQRVIGEAEDKLSKMEETAIPEPAEMVRVPKKKAKTAKPKRPTVSKIKAMIEEGASVEELEDMLEGETRPTAKKALTEAIASQSFPSIEEEE